MLRNHYGPGGYDPTVPGSNLLECWDSDAGTYTRYDGAGAPVETRALTADEAADMQRLEAATTAAANVSTIADLTAQAITDNDTYLALTAPTGDEQAAQVRRLTRQCQALARYLSTVVPHPGQPDNLADVTDVTTA